MKEPDSRYFHNLYGVRQRRVAYRKQDFIDYTLMTLISAAVIYFSFGATHWIAVIGLALCALMISLFPMRHGMALTMPVIVRRPQDILYMAAYKIRNVKPVFFVAAVILLLENLFIYLTPSLAHHVELMRKIGLGVLYLHFIGLTVYRTAVLVAHWKKQDLIREFLLQTSWKKYLVRQPSVRLHLLHAYATGVLSHIVMIAPWYLVISYASFSLIATPVTCTLNFFCQLWYLKVHNSWFYRDHWLGHNSEFEFIYLHGTHHDAIPSGVIGVGGNGHLEGFLRHVIAFPLQFFNPIIAGFFFSSIVREDIDGHQYIPGIFPKRTRHFHEITQHTLHHYGRLEPYSFGLKTNQPGLSQAARDLTRGLPAELRDSIELDEKLTGFKWDNPAYRRFLQLFEKFQPEAKGG